MEHLFERSQKHGEPQSVGQALHSSFLFPLQNPFGLVQLMPQII